MNYEILGYDVTDEFDIGPNGNFHGEYDSIPGRNLCQKMTLNVSILN